MAKAAIIGVAGGVWASSSGYSVSYLFDSFILPPLFHTSARDDITVWNDLTPSMVLQLSAEEQKAIVSGFNDPSSVQASGVRLAGNKFFIVQANPRSIYGKKQVRPLLTFFLWTRN